MIKMVIKLKVSSITVCPLNRALQRILSRFRDKRVNVQPRQVEHIWGAWSQSNDTDRVIVTGRRFNQLADIRCSAFLT